MIDHDLTSIDLRRALWMTRDQKRGISIEEVAEIIKKEFDKAEVDALIKELLKVN